MRDLIVQASFENFFLQNWKHLRIKYPSLQTVQTPLVIRYEWWTYMRTVSLFPVFWWFPHMDHRTCRTWRQPRSKTCDCTETSRAPERSPTSSLSSGNGNLKVSSSSYYYMGVLILLSLIYWIQGRFQDFPSEEAPALNFVSELTGGESNFSPKDDIYIHVNVN